MMEKTVQVEKEKLSSVESEIKEESVDVPDFLNDQPSLIKVEIKQESLDIPDYVDASDYSDGPNEKKLRKQQDYHHQCVTCNNRYRKQSYLEIHQAVHDPQAQGVCPICPTTFTGTTAFNKRKFIIHINQHIRTKMKEDKEKECVCSYCQKKFDTRRRLHLHTRVHTGERPYECDSCGEHFKLLGALRNHKVTHTGLRDYVCEICDGTFTTSSSLNRHMKRKHQEKQNFDCKQCDGKYSTVGLLKAHEKRVHTVKSVVKIKKESHKQYEGLKKLNSNRQTTYECLLCGDLLSSLFLYTEHKREHMQYTKEEYEDKKSKQYGCKFCSKSFGTIQNTFRHLHVHMEKTDQCQLCYDYYSKYGLKKHMVRCHKALQCKICLKLELGKHKLYRHYRKYHSETVKKFTCKLCKGQYMTKKALYIHHSIVHIPNNYIPCNFCGTEFVFTTELETHMTSNHMKDNMYVCPLCKIECSNRKEILRHNSQHQMKRQLAVTKNAAYRAKKPSKSKNYWTVAKNSRIRCPKCMKTLTTLRSYKSHNKFCKNRIKVELTKSKCKFCHRILLDSFSHRKHTKSHSNILFQCKYCDVFYDKSVELNKHRRMHHVRAKKYWCPLCNHDFKKNHELMRHKMNHFRRKPSNS